MQKRVLILSVSCFLAVLLLISFVSAGWFGDLLSKFRITGRAVGDHGSCGNCTGAGYFWCEGVSNASGLQNTCGDGSQFEGDCNFEGDNAISNPNECPVIPPVPSDYGSCGNCTGAGYFWCEGVSNASGLENTCGEASGDFGQSCEIEEDKIIKNSSKCPVVPIVVTSDDFGECDACIGAGYWWCQGVSNASGLENTCGEASGDFGQSCEIEEDKIIKNSSKCPVVVTLETNGGEEDEDNGNGGGSGENGTYTITNTELQAGIAKSFSINERLKFSVNEEDHYVKLITMTLSTAVIDISSDVQRATLRLGEKRKFEITNDDYYDLELVLDSNQNNQIATVTIKSIYEKITVDSVQQEDDKENEATDLNEEEEENEESSLPWFWILIIVLIIIVIALIVIYILYKRKQSYEENVFKKPDLDNGSGGSNVGGSSNLGMQNQNNPSV